MSPSRGASVPAISTGYGTYIRCAKAANDRGCGGFARCLRLETLSHLELVCRARSHHLAQKGFEHEQRPERYAVIARAGLMLVDHLPQKTGIEVTGVHQYRSEHCIPHSLAQRSAEPAGERHGKAHLR